MRLKEQTAVITGGASGIGSAIVARFVREGARVAIVEDTVTTGDSALKAIAAVEALGCTVVTVMALVDRLDGARELLESKGYAFAPLFTVRDLGIDAA